ncbi:MAG TPA: hypothetical protein VGB55_00520 [Tepidisphaeraceae bacterium]|jgi:hypothetical protein
MRTPIAILLTAATSLAGPPTRPLRTDVAPKDPPQVQPLGQVIDRDRPAYIPTFVQKPPASPLQEERDWANTHTYPPILFFGYLPYGYGSFGGYRSHHGSSGAW